MPVASPRLLVALAALTWCVGGVMLVAKGGRLLVEAEALAAGRSWPWIAASLGVLVGVVKAGLLYAPACRKNLARIRSLEHPHVLGFYRPGFFLALALMIAVGAVSTHLANGSYPALVVVAGIDFSLGTGLLASSAVFWIRRRRDSTESAKRARAVRDRSTEAGSVVPSSGSCPERSSSRRPVA
jgi:hypothetical protein